MVVSIDCVELGVRVVLLAMLVSGCVWWCLVVYSIIYTLAPGGCFLLLPSKWAVCALCSYSARLTAFTIHVGV